MNKKAFISIVVLATAFVSASAHELRGSPNVITDRHRIVSASLFF